MPHNAVIKINIYFRLILILSVAGRFLKARSASLAALLILPVIRSVLIALLDTARLAAWSSAATSVLLLALRSFLNISIDLSLLSLGIFLHLRLCLRLVVLASALLIPALLPVRRVESGDAVIADRSYELRHLRFRFSLERLRLDTVPVHLDNLTHL